MGVGPETIMDITYNLANGDTVDGAVMQQIKDAVNSKVDKGEGKVLSTNDYTNADKAKLAGITTGATANDTDANLKNRANHTGTQLAETISDFGTTVLATVLTGLSAAARSLPGPTDGLLTALGKIVKYLTDLGALAFKGSVDLSGSDATGTLATARMPALTGDVTTSAGAVATTIEANAVTNTKLAQVATQIIKGRKTAGSGNVEDLTVSDVLNWLSATQGAILFRGASAWSALAPGISGQVLQSGGASANPSWATVSGGNPYAKSNPSGTSISLAFNNNQITYIRHTTTGNTTYTPSGGSDGDLLVLIQTIGSAGHTTTFASTTWPGATTTTPTTIPSSAGKTIEYTLINHNGTYRVTGWTVY